MIFDVTIVVVLRCQEACSYNIMNLTDKCYVCSDCSTSWPFPSLHVLQPLYCLRHNIEIRSINNLTMASMCSSERKNCTSLTLNKNLEMIKFSGEGMSKAKIGQKLGLLLTKL